jgi:SNF2 family DNA or RNA helicase
MLNYSRPPVLGIKHQGFAYQVDAVEVLKNLEYAAVFHEQGLGKTKIAIDIALWWLKKKTVDSVLFVTKKGLINNWRQELVAHSFLTPLVLDQDSRSNFLAFNSPSAIYLTHYEACRGDEKQLRLFLKTRRVGIVCDEAHKLKNPDSSLTKTSLSLSPLFKKRLILTGTPIANRPYDLWALIRFLDHGKSIPEDFALFKQQLELDSDLSRQTERGKEFREKLAALPERIRAFSVRENKKTAGLILPDKEFHTVGAEFEPEQKRLYGKFREGLAVEILKDGKVVSDDVEDILKRLLRLVQAASNPKVVDSGYTAVPGKFPVLEQLLTKIPKEEKVILWSTFTANVDWLASSLQAQGTVKVHGKLSMPVRQASIESFKSDPEVRVLVATPASAKEGLTLTVANHCIFYDRGFSLDDYLQAQDRIHRISQSRTCHIYNLIIPDSIDEWVDELIETKSLAARLGQGDINVEQFLASASNRFNEILGEILNH